MRIAVPDFVSSSFFPLLVAKELGLFNEEGQDVEIVLSNALAAVKSLRDGTVDFSAGLAHAPMMFFPEWRGVKLVAAVSQGTPCMLVMKAGLAKRGEITAVKGRRIAASGWDLGQCVGLRGCGSSGGWLRVVGIVVLAAIHPSVALSLGKSRWFLFFWLSVWINGIGWHAPI